MDPKATAKSKRGHSLHGRRNNPSSSSIAAKKKASTSASASGAVAQSKGEAPRPRRRPELPSNWDRYDDDVDDDSGAMGGQRGESSSAAMAQGSEMLAKSKGADYRYLIEQARSQPQPIASFPDEFAFDFLQCSSSMLSTKGEMLLSLCEDDNFIVDDFVSSPNYEVSFLSMDLNALAGQLSKVRTSQRLFMEDDLFMEEMLVSEPKENNQQPDRSAIIDGGSNAEREDISSSDISVEKIQSLTSTSESPMETELDKLINSFDETKISRASTNSTNTSIVLSEKKLTSSLDDVLDDLLAEASLLTGDQILDTVSSKKDIIGSIDDLLGQAGMDVKKDKQGELSVDSSSSSVPTKQVDDFDSWFDSL
ncbi:hypothetical protein FCM35_KLT21340 [Carex littledalei]|uniref:Uncharacterized protein n=1 Tax=Carex littledalei TaxID=544730 RepID=A0A833VD99_9POAL|nr:hypothetical protein FCM35_KLT21340 [Carex littledalei]